MKKITVIVMMIVVTALFLPGCEKDAPDVKRPVLKGKELTGKFLTYQRKISQESPYYKGKMPLTLLSIKKMIGQYEMIVGFNEFDDFNVIYLYNEIALKYSGIPEGARAYSKNGALLAEAKYLKIIPSKAVEIEEFHYDSQGKVSFYCVSTMSFGLGLKEKETATSGKKRKEYFFLWPVSTR